MIRWFGLGHALVLLGEIGCILHGATLLLTIKQLQGRIDKQPRAKILNLPTPLKEMPRLTKALGSPRLWIKRDDCTGLAFGGNKERKAEFVLGYALSKKADVVITTGGIQSNHVRCTTAAARKLGVKSVLIIEGEEPEAYDGNLLLDYLMGAELRFVAAKEGSIDSIMEETARELEQKGHRPYVIPMGASYDVGAVAYANAMLELLTQAHEKGFAIDYVVHAAGSGGTQAGLVLANKAVGSKAKILGVCVAEEGSWLADRTVAIANEASRLLGLDIAVTSKDVNIEVYAGKGYGVLSTEVTDAIRLVAQTEGILLDPVYTGKAMAGLIDMIKSGRFSKDENVVFVHTGGLPALFPYKQGLVQGTNAPDG